MEKRRYRDQIVEHCLWCPCRSCIDGQSVCTLTLKVLLDVATSPWKIDKDCPLPVAGDSLDVLKISHIRVESHSIFCPFCSSDHCKDNGAGFFRCSECGERFFLMRQINRRTRNGKNDGIKNSA